jgi:Mn-containing catalase
MILIMEITKGLTVDCELTARGGAMCGRYSVIDGPLVQDLLEILGLEEKRRMFSEWLICR